MKTFACRCGQTVYFDSDQCVQCSVLLGFDPDTQAVLALEILESGLLQASSGQTYRRCNNSVQHDICNWLINSEDEQPFCKACRLNRIIPNLANPANLKRWQSLEEAKRRLLYTLLSLDLPIDGSLAFEFLEDGRTDPERYGDSRVTSGYLNGVITLNVLEADPVAREAERAALNEPQRTLLGHMRHESGHHFYHLLNETSAAGATPNWGDFKSGFATYFGDASADYGQALEKHYSTGAPSDWQMRFISTYAASHPLEDWAETWSHYLNMVDSLDTGISHGFLPNHLGSLSFDERLGRWRELCTVANELNRSGGAEDLYPYIVSPVAANKLQFVEQSIARL